MNGQGRVHSALKLAHHRHTARPLAHHHTSYRALFLVLAVMGLSMATIQFASADDYVVSVTVPTDVFSTAAMITSPANGSIVDSSSITIEGTCEVVRSGTYVTLLRESQAIGTTVCRSDNTFSLGVTLILGANRLEVTQDSGSGGVGPLGTKILVTYAVPVVVTPVAEKPPAVPNSPQQLIVLPSGTTFQQQSVNNVLWIVFTIQGGTTPYTIEANWGDGKVESIQQTGGGLTVRLKHTYETAGSYTITIRATDSLGQQSISQYTALISEPLSLVGTGFSTPTIRYWQSISSGSLIMLLVWVSYTLLSLIVVSLWFFSPTHTLLGSPISVHNGLKLVKPRR